MKRNTCLAHRLREVFLNGTWIANTNYKDQLSKTSWQEATCKVHNLNSIAALTFHVNYYLEGLIQVLHGGALNISDKYSFDMPAIKNEHDWNDLVARFLMHAEQFSALVEQLDDAVFDHNFVTEKYGTYLRNIDGIIEHSYYHLGQLVLIKKMVSNTLQHP